MSNITITNLNVGNVVLKSGEFEDDALTFAGAATIKEGTILARDSSSLKLVPFVKGGTTNENGIPKAVITYEVVATGGGDIPVRALISGVVRKELLVIDADGDSSNVDAKVRDELRDYNIDVVNVQELAEIDNPQ
jgi:hypothetical protein